jgi:PAS domain-containing protein
MGARTSKGQRADSGSTVQPSSPRASGNELQHSTSEAGRDGRTAFETLVEQAPFGVYIVDSSLRIVQINRGSQENAFRNVRPAIGRQLDDAMRVIWPEETAQWVVEEFRRTLRTGEPYFSKHYIERRADIGETEAYEWELHRITLPDGQFGVVCY